MPTDLHPADIQQAYFEYRASFKTSLATLFYGGRQGEVIAVVHKALSPWGVGLENIFWNQAAKNLGEVQLTFGVPLLFASIQLSLSGLTMNALNPDWSRAPQFISLFQAGVEAVTLGLGQELQSQQTTLGFHVKPGAIPFRTILEQFVNARLLDGENAEMLGVSVYHRDFTYVIDKSVVIPNGV
ncbi:MAG: hypothetical protein WBM04_11490, partial [Candidatus Korobacteraceae bacterium]